LMHLSNRDNFDDSSHFIGSTVVPAPWAFDPQGNPAYPLVSDARKQEVLDYLANTGDDRVVPMLTLADELVARWTNEQVVVTGQQTAKQKTFYVEAIQSLLEEGELTIDTVGGVCLAPIENSESEVDQNDLASVMTALEIQAQTPGPHTVQIAKDSAKKIVTWLNLLQSD
jgi:hypothetical protein